MALMQGVQGSPSVSTGGSATWLGDLRGLLGDGFGMYLQYEAMQKQQSPAAALLDKQYTTELKNGAATVYETTAAQPGQSAQPAQTVNLLGMAIPKMAAYAGGAVVLLVALKKMGVL